MEQKEAIAYEIAMLTKENRELRNQVRQLTERYDTFVRDHEAIVDKLRKSVAKEKGKVKTKEKAQECKLFDVPCDLNRGDRVVITATQAVNPKLCKGFVLEVRYIHKNKNGLVTITGIGRLIYDIWEEERLSDLIVTNRYYNQSCGSTVSAESSSISLTGTE